VDTVWWEIFVNTQYVKAIARHFCGQIMAQCKYVNPETGKQCGSWPYKDPADPACGYCSAHARKLKLIPEERLRVWKERLSTSLIKAHASKNFGLGAQDRREKQSARMTEADRKELEDKQKDEKGAAKKLIHSIFGDQDYDAPQMVQDYREANADFQYTEKIKKTLFIGWYLSDPATRKPATLLELCKLLNMQMAVGREWIESDWFANDLSAALKRTMKLAEPYLDRMNVCRALGGDFKSFQEYNKKYAKHAPIEGEESPEDMFSPEINDEVLGTETGREVVRS
jgi:hypothetical protein